MLVPTHNVTIFWRVLNIKNVQVFKKVFGGIVLLFCQGYVEGNIIDLKLFFISGVFKIIFCYIKYSTKMCNIPHLKRDQLNVWAPFE